MNCVPVALLLLGAAQISPLISQHLTGDGGREIVVERIVVPPSAARRPTTTGISGHSHPGDTFVYVLTGRVLSRLGQGPELSFKAGEMWSEAPGEAHYIANASQTRPATLLVTFVVRDGARPLIQPIDAGHH